MLFEESDLLSLAKIARGEDASVGELVRKAVKQVYFDGADDILLKRRQVYDEMMELRKKIGVSKRKIDYKELINYGRKW